MLDSDKNSKIQPEDVRVNLDDGTAYYNLTHTGKIGGLYVGAFRFHCSLTPLQYLEADRDYRNLLGENASLATTHADNIAYALAQLKQRVLEAPPFWNSAGGRFGGGHIKDHDLIDLLLEAAVQAEMNYRKALEERHADALKRLQAQVEKMRGVNNKDITTEQAALNEKEEE